METEEGGVLEEVGSIPDISTRPALPEEYEESILPDDIIDEVPCIGDELINSYKIVEGGTRRGNALLVDSFGYTYNQKATGKKKNPTGKVTWRCSVRNKMVTCPATVLQNGSIFTGGSHHHVHEPQQGATFKVEVIATAKALAKEKVNIFSSASSLVDRAITATEGDDAACLNTVNIARSLNRLRQGDRPDEPDNLNFELDDNYIPKEFLQKDIAITGGRHLIFATSEQLALLKNARTWYVDATFRVVLKPFYQLFGIHAFVKGIEGNIKKVPLVFTLMSGKRKKDYKKVFKVILDILQECKVEKLVLDFEVAVWSAVRTLLPIVKLQGCSFHWNQAIWRKIQEIGLAAPYMNHCPTKDFIWQLMALPFLPEEHITTTFEQVELRVPPGPLKILMDYIKETWINGFWVPSDWTVFGQSIWTNNDVEGYHRKLNGMAGSSHIPFYVLVPLLYKKAKNVTVELRLVKDGKHTRRQRRQFRTVQGKIFALWKRYEDREITTNHLLKACSKICTSGPSQ